MTRAMDTLILTRAVYRRRYGTDLPEASIPSRFLEEIPVELVEDLGASRKGRVAPGTMLIRLFAGGSLAATQPAHDRPTTLTKTKTRARPGAGSRSSGLQRASGKSYNSIENIADFFASRGKKFTVPKLPVEAPKGRKGFRPGQKVRHPKYGEGTVYQREGEGEDAKITVQFPRFGLKKLVEKYAQLEGA